MSYPFSKLIADVGDDALIFQTLDTDVLSIHMARKGKEGHITFCTAPNNAQGLMRQAACGERSEMMGLVIWMPRAKAQAALDANRTKKEPRMSDVQLTREEKRTVIAKACGWVSPPRDCAQVPEHKWQSPLDSCCYDEIPDYFNSLDAIHEAICGMDESGRHHISVLAGMQVWGDEVGAFSQWTDWRDTFAILSLRADELAELFGKALNLWK